MMWLLEDKDQVRPVPLPDSCSLSPQCKFFNQVMISGVALEASSSSPGASLSGRFRFELCDSCVASWSTYFRLLFLSVGSLEVRLLSIGSLGVGCLGVE
jgi:hypothetical protein